MYGGGEGMNKYPLIGASILAVVLLVLASLTNVVGYQTVQESNQKNMTIELNEKELLFRTIVDMTNSKEIQKVILGSELTNKMSFDSDMKFSTFKIPMITEKFLKVMYTMGALFFRTLDKSRIQALIEHYPIMSQELQKKLSAVIEKDATLKTEQTQLMDFECDCENDNTTQWNFPALCLILYPLAILVIFLYSFTQFFKLAYVIMYLVGATLKCFWF